ncbi:MAG: hypothetical protein JW860_05915 [Sedimentisphaerales bacterium]|nr:hypothetical protein [Sedimentisphaerales bacterium]
MKTMMPVKIWLMVLITCVIFLHNIVLPEVARASVTKGEIDEIRKKSVIIETHKEKIREYVNDNIDALAKASSAGALTSLVQDLTDKMESEVNLEQVKETYSDVFTQAVQEGFRRVYPSFASIDNTMLSWNKKLSLVVIVSSTNNIKIINDLIILLEDPSLEIRYWAAKGLGMPRIQRYIQTNDPEAEVIRGNIILALKGAITDQASGLLISQIVDATPNSPDGLAVLQACAAQRVRKYQSWSVDHELVDLKILKKILEILKNNQLAQNQGLAMDLLQSGLELFSAAYQYYYKSMTYVDENGEKLELIPEFKRAEIETFLIETETELLRYGNTNRPPKFLASIQKKRWTPDMDGAYNYLVRTFTEIIKSAKGSEVLMPVVPDPHKDVIERARVFKLIE